MNIEEHIHNQSQLIDRRLDVLTIEKQVPFVSLLRGARYSLLNGGKRLRPILVLVTAETLGVPLETALDPACALEMIHTYSLIHDDLPCMDDDDFRRGKPSLHKAFSEGHAVLAGDFLLTFAFEVLANATHLTSDQKTKLINLLAINAGSEGMIGGQIMDIEAQEKNISLEFLREIHERKTGALITTAMEFGAVIANVNSEHAVILKQFGKEIGFAFQVIDDVLDVTTHKNSDLKNKKCTYVTLLGLENAQALALAHYKKAVEMLEKLPYDTAKLSALAGLLVNRKK